MLNIHQIHLKWVVATIPRFHTGGPFGSGTRLRHPCKPLGGLRCHDVVQDLWCHRKADETPGLDFFWENVLETMKDSWRFYQPNVLRKKHATQYYPNLLRTSCYPNLSKLLIIFQRSLCLQWAVTQKIVTTFFSPTPFNLLLTSKPNLGPITDIHCKHDPHI